MRPIDADYLKTWFGEKDLYTYDYIIGTIDDAPTVKLEANLLVEVKLPKEEIQELVDEVEEKIRKEMEQPEPHWIPCSERLPDYEGYDEVLTTVNGRAENVRYINAVITNAEYDDTDKQWYINGCAAKWVARNGKVMSDVDVLAWMPLPPAYKGDE